jgi:hypothetical protein
MGKFRDLNLIWVHEPNDGIEDQKRFYGDLDELYEKLPQFDSKIALNEFKAVVEIKVFY